MLPALSRVPDFPAYRSMTHSQPNELDFHRIKLGLERRKRYRYVQPEIRCIADGYQIVSACCSRNIDPDGGTIDIARLVYQDYSAVWELYRKDHESGLWILHGEYLGLPRMLEILNEDFDRRFWQ
ncbi:MAG: DUF3024 domain-containing protein [Methylococcaceae bacterium]